MFLEYTREKPANNFFDTVREMPEVKLRQEFAEAVQLQWTDNPLLPNATLLRKHLDVANSDLKKASLLQNLDADAIAAAEAAAEAGAIAVDDIFIFEKTNAINEVQLAKIAVDGFRPMIVEKLGGFETQVKLIKEPPRPTPYFAVIEEYTTCSFLGDYGAGRTIKTFSLLPGEKTVISVKTYKENESVKSYSENVLDSFSESSTNELEKLIENETGYSDTTSSNVGASSEKTKGGNFGANIGASLFKIVNVGVSGGFSSNSSQSSSISNSATRSSNVRSLDKALSKHVSTSNANRSIDINTSSAESYKEGEEVNTVREIQNINKSRVLNFVFRQMLQQYITITYLSNIKIAFCNGYEESLRVVDIEELDKLLEDTIVPDCIEEVRRMILKNYCTIYNYMNQDIPFIEQVEHIIGECMGMSDREIFYRIRRDIIDTWKAEEGGLVLNVKGPILHATTHTLKTSSTVVDAFLGQGKALDCFNMKIQDAIAIGKQLESIEHLQKMAIIQNVSDPEKRAELYKKVFDDCCCGSDDCCCPKCIILKDESQTV